MPRHALKMHCVALYRQGADGVCRHAQPLQLGAHPIVIYICVGGSAPAQIQKRLEGASVQLKPNMVQMLAHGAQLV